ncbi:hypothetical protein G3I17_30190 [Streptomyces sp. SID13031]|nr:hypothetical protein [Streptomyces sp. SID13031]
MRASVLNLFPAYYDATQVASAELHIAGLDLALIEDGTYYVHEADGEIVACVDAARAAGFTRLALMSTLPGVPLYKSFGFIEVEPAELTMPDGVVLAGVAMERAVDQNRPVDPIGDAR